MLPRRLLALLALALLAVLLLVVSSPIAASADLLTFPDCIAGPLSGYPICDSSLPVEQRAADLVSRLTTAEKILRLGNTSPAIDRIGLPAYQWWSEALHGVGWSPGVQWASYGQDYSNATSFPMPINLGAAFDDAIVHSIAGVISTEARAFSNVGRAGLDFWTPNINPFRDPRWGRGQETPGEDPYHISRYVYQLVRGLQEGDDPRYYKVVADCKHFAGYDIENWHGNDRTGFDAIISQQDLVEYYLPPFESCIRDAHVGSIMCSYNSINGVPMCANEHFIQDIARGAWGLDGWVTSDCGAISTIIYNHNYVNTTGEAAAAALIAGVDVNCGVFYQNHTAEALAAGLIQESQIDTALMNQFKSLLRAGYFDDPNVQPYRSYSVVNVSMPASQQLALTAALESLVLLKNDGVLPLSPVKAQTVAIVGPMSNDSDVMRGTYGGFSPYLIDIATGVRQFAPSITVKQALGCLLTVCNTTDGFADAVSVASGADVIVFAGGLDYTIEEEELDRDNITWPGYQQQLIQELEALGKPLIVVALGGGQVDMTQISSSSATNAILWVGYPGQSGGAAIAQVLFGAYSPAGRLPVTQYPGDYVNQVPMTDMSLRESATNPGRTYKFYTGTAVYPFGWGLSYTTFAYSWASGSAETSMDLTHAMGGAHKQHRQHAAAVAAATSAASSSSSSSSSSRPVFHIQSLMKQVMGRAGVDALPLDSEDDRVAFTSYSVNVTNTGAAVTSDVVVLGFLTNQAEDAAAREQAPISELYAYERVHALAPGETRTVEFYVTLRQVSGADAVTGDRWVHPGVVRTFVDVEQRLVHEFELVGEPALLAAFPGGAAASVVTV